MRNVFRNEGKTKINETSQKGRYLRESRKNQTLGEVLPYAGEGVAVRGGEERVKNEGNAQLRKQFVKWTILAHVNGLYKVLTCKHREA